MKWKCYSRFTKKSNNLRIHIRGGGRFWSYFRGKNRQIYMAKFRFLVLGGLLDTGSRPSVVTFWYWFLAQYSIFQIIAFFCKPTVHPSTILYFWHLVPKVFILYKILLVKIKFIWIRSDDLKWKFDINCRSCTILVIFPQSAIIFLLHFSVEHGNSNKELTCLTVGGLFKTLQHVSCMKSNI